MEGSVHGRWDIFREGARASRIAATGPYLSALFGGVLILSNGIVLWSIGLTPGAIGPGPTYPTPAVGIVEGLLGTSIILLATSLFLDPRHARGVGSTIIVLSVLSIFGGGGFLVGTALGVLGGVGALFVNRALDVRPISPQIAPTIDQICVRCGKRYSGSVVSCPFCGSPSEVLGRGNPQLGPSDDSG